MRTGEDPRLIDGGQNRMILTVPIGLGRAVDMKIPDPLTSAEWAQMMAVLAAVRPALVEPGPRLIEDVSFDGTSEVIEVP